MKRGSDDFGENGGDDSHCTAGESLTEKLGQEAWQCIIMMTAIIMIMMIVGMMMTVIMMIIMVMTIFVDLNW